MQLYCFFLSVMHSKDLAPFSYISPQKNPLSPIKYELTIEVLSANGQKSQKTDKSGPIHKPRYRASAKISFIIVIQPFYGCQRNARKYITVTVSVRVSVTVRVSLVWFVSTNSFGASSVAICCVQPNSHASYRGTWRLAVRTGNALHDNLLCFSNSYR